MRTRGGSQQIGGGREGLWVIVLAALALVAAAMLRLFPPDVAILAVLLVSVVTVATTVVVVRWISVPQQEYLQGVAASMEESFRSFKQSMTELVAASKVEWIVTHRELLEIERGTEAEEIWIVSRYLMDEIDNDLVFQSVHSNLEDGKRYRFITPNTQFIRNKALAIKTRHAPYAESVSFWHVPEVYFTLVPIHSIVIYGPLGSLGETAAYMHIPLDSPGEKYFVRVRGQFVRKLVEELLESIEEI